MNHQPPIQWYRTPVEKPVMKELTQRSDVRGFVQCLSVLLLSGTTGALAFYSARHWSVPVTVLTVYLHGMCYFFHGAHAAPSADNPYRPRP